uniref:Uncharacterized protein n=1 Tax=Ditylenchus dipsaci TaxID=166011 RepID=A0A915CWM6_9BILA
MSVLPLLLLLATTYTQSAPSLPSPSTSITSKTASLYVPDLVPEQNSASAGSPVSWQPRNSKIRSEAITSSSEILYSSGPSSDSADSYGGSGDSFVLKPAVEVKLQGQFVLPPAESVVPKMTGSIEKSPVEKWNTKFGAEKDNFGGPITNPAAYYMEGASLEDIKAPKCKWWVQEEGSLRQHKACHQTFVPLNGCMDNRGYPVGMRLSPGLQILEK